MLSLFNVHGWITLWARQYFIFLGHTINLRHLVQQYQISFKRHYLLSYFDRHSNQIPLKRRDALHFTSLFEIIVPVYEVVASKRERQHPQVVGWMLEQRKGQEHHPVKIRLKIKKNYICLKGAGRQKNSIKLSKDILEIN